MDFLQRWQCGSQFALPHHGHNHSNRRRSPESTGHVRLHVGYQQQGHHRSLTQRTGEIKRPSRARASSQVILSSLVLNIKVPSRFTLHITILCLYLCYSPIARNSDSEDTVYIRAACARTRAGFFFFQWHIPVIQWFICACICFVS